MATNPMQRKARNSFLLGVVLTLILSAAVIALLVMQLKKYRDEEALRNANSMKIKVLNADVESGEEITASMLSNEITIDKTLIPSDAIDASALAAGKMVAKVDLKKNTVLTRELIAEEEDQTTDDLRIQEYNIFVLPTQLDNDEYVDIRLALPTGEDYIVASKKKVEIPEVDGVLLQDTILVKMTEGETITMNNAIVDAYRILGSKLYVTTYVEAGNQKAAEPTYIPTQSAIELITRNPNIVNEAKQELYDRYRNNVESVRNNVINPSINNNGDEGEDNVKTKTEQSITNSKENRKKYLQSLAGSVE